MQLLPHCTAGRARTAHDERHDVCRIEPCGASAASSALLPDIGPGGGDVGVFVTHRQECGWQRSRRLPRKRFCCAARQLAQQQAAYLPRLAVACARDRVCETGYPDTLLVHGRSPCAAVGRAP